VHLMAMGTDQWEQRIARDKNIHPGFGRCHAAGPTQDKRHIAPPRGSH